MIRYAHTNEGDEVSQVTFLGKPLQLAGDPPRAGERARDFTAVRFSPEEGLVEVSLADLPAKPCLLSVVPSLDTNVCSQQTKTFNERLAGYGPAIAAYTVSVDLPFAQNRFCGAEGIDNVAMLSDYQRRSFGTSWGMLIDELQLLARGVFVLDASGVVTYAEVVDEVTDHPSYDAVLGALDELANR